MKFDVGKMWNNGRIDYACITQADTPMYYLPSPLGTEAMKTLNVGCGKWPIKNDGWINADIVSVQDVDVTMDCQEVWPFETGSLRNIFCYHVLEHLDNVQGFLNEAHRCLTPGGCLLVIVPHAYHDTAMSPLNHRRPYNEDFFVRLALIPEGTRDLELIAEDNPLWFPQIIAHRIRDEYRFLTRWYCPDRIAYWCVRSLLNICSEQLVWLMPAKGTQ